MTLIAHIRVPVEETSWQGRRDFEKTWRHQLVEIEGHGDPEIDFLPVVNEHSDPVDAALKANGWTEPDRAKVVKGMRIAFELGAAQRRLRGEDKLLAAAQRLADTLLSLLDGHGSGWELNDQMLAERALNRWRVACGLRAPADLEAA